MIVRVNRGEQYSDILRIARTMDTCGPPSGYSTNCSRTLPVKSQSVKVGEARP